MIARLDLDILLLALQWHCISQHIEFLFFHSVFFSAHLEGFSTELASTVLSVCIVWYSFIPPQLSWILTNPFSFYSAAPFLISGYLFSDTFERIRQMEDGTLFVVRMSLDAPADGNRLSSSQLIPAMRPIPAWC